MNSTQLRINSLKKRLSKSVLADTDACISFLEIEDVLTEGESDDIGVCELMNMAAEYIDNMILCELETAILYHVQDEETPDYLDVEAIAKAINWETKKWVANCYAVSCAIVEAGLVKGKAVFGKYHGKIHEDSFFDQAPFTNHGWILTEDGKILDPTRWVFEAVEPYMYVTTPDDKEYDRGSNVIRDVIASIQEAPIFDDSGRVIDVKDEEVENYLSMLLGKNKVANKISLNQAMCIASSSINTLGNAAKPLFTWFEANGLKAFVPIDNFEMVMEG